MGKNGKKAKEIVKTVTGVASTVAAIGGILIKTFSDDKK